MGSSYAWDAEDYASNSAVQFAWARELLDKLELRGDEALLDIGCGDGKVSAAIGARLPAGSVLGVDSSAEMIALARAKYAVGVDKLSFAEADARSLAYTARFDVVFSNAALHWTKEHEPVVAGIARALKPGGRLLLQMGGQGNVARFVAELEATMASAAWCEHFDNFEFPFGFYGPEQYGPWLATVGLGRPSGCNSLPRTWRTRTPLRSRAGCGRPGCPTRSGCQRRVARTLSRTWSRAI